MTNTDQTDVRMPSPREDFLFDLRGYLVLKNAADDRLVDRLNQAIDDIPDLERQEWWGNAQRHADAKGEFRLQNCVEAGEPFEELIDHPSWVGYASRYAGEQVSYVHGLFIDECFASVRGPGGYSHIHSGGYGASKRTEYSYSNGYFRCGQVNVILALGDVGPGDGATMVIPGSHKSNFPYPEQPSDKIEDLDEAVPVYLEKGDALFFVDSILHGSDTRTNAGDRRVTIYRYGPKWGATRYGYEYSPELLDRLTPERRAILQPIEQRRPARQLA